MAKSSKRKGSSKGKTPKKIKNNVENDDIDESVDPDVDDEEDGGEGQYVVEKVVDKRKRGGQIEYLIKWKDYDDADNTWERMYGRNGHLFNRLQFTNFCFNRSKALSNLECPVYTISFFICFDSSFVSFAYNSGTDR